MISHGSIAPLGPADFAVMADADDPNTPARSLARPSNYMFDLQTGRTTSCRRMIIRDQPAETWRRGRMKDPPVVKAPGISIPAIYTFCRTIPSTMTSPLKKVRPGVLADPNRCSRKDSKLIVNSRSPDLDSGQRLWSQRRGRRVRTARRRANVDTRGPERTEKEDAFHDLPSRP